MTTTPAPAVRPAAAASLPGTGRGPTDEGRGPDDPSPRIATAHSDPFQILAADHAMLQQDLARLLQLRPERTEEARRLADTLARALADHFRSEEAVIYPVCERLFGGREGAAAVLRADHRSIRERLDDLREGGRRGEPFSQVRVDMVRLEVSDHFGREERVLFPLAAALLSGTERDALARRLRSRPLR